MLWHRQTKYDFRNVKGVQLLLLLLLLKVVVVVVVVVVLQTEALAVLAV